MLLSIIIILSIFIGISIGVVYLIKSKDKQLKKFISVSVVTGLVSAGGIGLVDYFDDVPLEGEIIGDIGSVIDTWEYDAQEAINNYESFVVRINNTDIYVSVAVGDTGTDNIGILRTFKVWGNNGTIQESIIDSYTYDSSSCSYSSIRHITGTDKYIIGYTDGETGTIKTIAISEDGTIGTTIDTQVIQNGASPVDIKQLNTHVWITSYCSVWGSEDGFMKTWWIDLDGTINNTVLDEEEFDETFGKFASTELVDTDTVAILYVSTGNNGEFSIVTHNISSVGIITDTYADFYSSIEVDPYYYNEFVKIGTNMFAAMYTTSTGDVYCKTIGISDAGIIDEDVTDTLLVVNGAEVIWLNYVFVKDPNTYGDGVIALSYCGIGSSERDGYISTFNVSDDGTLGASVIETYEFSDDCNKSACILYLDENYYMIVYATADRDGFIKTIEIQTIEEEVSSVFSISGLTSDELTWNGQRSQTVWSNSSGEGSETLLISVTCNSTTEVDKINVYLTNLVKGGYLIGASNISLYISSDNSNYGLVGTYTNGGSNMTLNSAMWNGGTMGTNPFPITSGTSDTLYARFKLVIPSSGIDDGEYTSSGYHVYFEGTIT